MIRALLAAALLSALSACGGVPMVLSGVGGGLTVLKDVFDVDVSWHQLQVITSPPAPVTPPVAARPAFVPLTMQPVPNP